MPTKRAPRNCCVTINNWTPEQLDTFKTFCTEKASYWVYGKEVGETGTPHLQCYVEFSDQVTFAQAQQGFSKGHMESRKGTSKQASGYCKKGSEQAADYEIFFHCPSQDWDGEEYGTLSNQGKRTDIDQFVEALETGASMRSTALSQPSTYVKYHKGFHALRNMMLEPRMLDANPQVIWLHGPTGYGKTRDAYTKYWPDEPHYVWRPSNGNWWDGYDGESKVIMDEFRGQMPWADLLGLLDRNEFRAPVKGGFVHIQADKFVITSPFAPEDVYRSDDRVDRVAQLIRRITERVDYAPPPIDSFGQFE